MEEKKYVIQYRLKGDNGVDQSFWFTKYGLEFGLKSDAREVLRIFQNKQCTDDPRIAEYRLALKRSIITYHPIEE